MLKKLVILLIVLLILPTVYAITFYTNEEGVLWTSCKNWTYTNSSATITIYYPNSTKFIDDQYMFNFTTGQFYFNFTVPTIQGNYLANVDCNIAGVHGYDEESFVVKGDSGMIVGITILLPLILGFFFVMGAFSLSEKHAPLRIFLFLLSIITFFSSAHFATVAIIEFYSFGPMQEAIANTVYWVGIVLWFMISYFIIYLIWKIFDHMAQKKKEKLEY